MKKLLLGLGILGSFVSAFAQENSSDKHVYLKVGTNLLSGYTKKYEDNSFKSSKDQKFSITNGKTKRLGFSVAMEATKNVSDNFEIGLGVAYQNHNKFKGYAYNVDGKKQNSVFGKFDSVPVYLTGKYNFNTNGDLRPYLKADLGYSFNINEKNTKITFENKSVSYKTKVNNGLYVGVGGGLEYNNFLVDLSYTINYGRARLTSNDNKGSKDSLKTTVNPMSFGAITLSLGYKFDM